jgi:hypothetical protein
MVTKISRQARVGNPPTPQKIDLPLFILMTELHVIDIKKINGSGFWHDYPPKENIMFGFSCGGRYETALCIEQYCLTLGNARGKAYYLYTVSYRLSSRPNQIVFEFPESGILGASINRIPNLGEVFTADTIKLSMLDRVPDIKAPIRIIPSATCCILTDDGYCYCDSNPPTCMYPKMFL